MITVTTTGATGFNVVVSDGRGATRHRVTAAPETVARLAQGRSPEALIKAAFRFLLDRELKDSILRQFDLMAIARYFTEIETELPRYLYEVGK